MATFRAVLKKKNNQYVTNEDGESLIYIRYGHKQKAFAISTETKVNPVYWQGETNTEQPIKRSLRGYTTKLEFINAVKHRLEKILQKTVIEGIEPTIDVVKELYKQELEGTKKAEQPPFFAYFDKYIEYAETTKSPSSIKQYRACKNNLEEYAKKKKLKISFDSINIGFYDKYIKYLLQEKGVSNSTVGNQIKNLKTYLNYAIKRGGVELKVTLSDFKVFQEKPGIIYLTQSELKKLQDHDFSKSTRLEKVRDLFLLGCKTGLRISDLIRLGKRHINDGWISLKAHKNKNKIEIPIMAISEGPCH